MDVINRCKIYEQDTDLVFFEYVQQGAVDIDDGDTEDQSYHILDNSYV